MKIAQVVCVFPPYKGGIGTMAYNHAKSLAENGHEVTVFTPEYKGDKDVIEHRDGFTIHRIVPFLKFGNGAILLKVIKQLKEFDVIHLHYPFFGTAEILWLLKKIKKDNLKLVLTYHMDIVGGIFLRPFFYFHTKFIMPRIVKSADKIIVTSNDYASHSNIKKLFFRIPDKFIDIPPEVDTQHFIYDSEFNSILNKLNLNKSKDKILLFVGGLDKAHYFKGVEFLIDSFNVLKRSFEHESLKLVIVGDGDLKVRYEKKVIENGLKDDIIFAGNVDYNDLVKYYSLSDITILPSIDKSEAFGIVLIESLSCSTPVIASNLPGVRTVVSDGVDGYVVKVKNEGELAFSIKQLLFNEEKRLEFGVKGREKVVSNFNKEIVVKKLIELYKSVIEK